MGEGTRKSRPSQRCDRRLRQQAGKNRLGGAAARRTVRRHRNAGGGIELGRARSKRPTVNRVCERVTTGWPDSRTTLRKPGSKNGAIDATNLALFRHLVRRLRAKNLPAQAIWIA